MTSAQSQQPQSDSDFRGALIAAIAAYIAANASIGWSTLPANLVNAMRSLGLAPSAINAAMKLANSTQIPAIRGGTALKKTIRAEPIRRASYLVSAAERLTEKIERSDDDSRTLGRALFEGLQAERTYFVLHHKAGAKRRSAARRADAVAREHGPDLVWRAVRDDRTTPDCLALDGKEFHVDSPPGGIYPGQMHVKCRCEPRPAGS